MPAGSLAFDGPAFTVVASGLVHETGCGMDPIVMAAGTAVVSAMATSAWEQARDAVVALWHRSHSDKAGQVGEELAVVRAEVLTARREGDAGVEQELENEWRAELQRLLRRDPAIATEVRRLLEEQLAPLLADDDRTRVRSVVQTASATGHSTIYQAGRDITTHEPPVS